MTLTAADQSLTISGDTIAAELLDRYAQRYLHYAKGLYTDAAAAFIAQWTRMISDRQSELDRIYAATIAEYSAADDYTERRSETITHGHQEATEHGHVLTDAGTKTRELEYDSSEQHDITTFDSLSYRADTQDVHTGTDTSVTTDDLTHTHSGTDTIRHSGQDVTSEQVSGYRSGPTERIQAEIRMRTEIDLTDMIIDLYARRYLFY